MRNGRPYAIKIAPAAVIAFAALAVGYGLGEQAQLGERDVQTVTQEVRRTGDAKRLCMTVKTGGRIDAITCQVLDGMTGELRCAQKSVLLQIVRHGDAYPADGNHRRTYRSLEARGYTQDVGYGRYAITTAGRRALQKDLS
ncbi:hypothetical protein MCC10094_0155 [Bifidobacterium longum subsp. longum]|uniref:hypothetical protein n=1 Tax=Bifidobacterium longum TaxID=216816 RepID=UPI0010D3E74D|nr:hypothetical protein [Bifidobacterium longum]TCF29679.1 hypothetical protein MCC10094_0155 [Bifidobacterium longum subsp. longum]